MLVVQHRHRGERRRCILLRQMHAVLLCGTIFLLGSPAAADPIPVGASLGSVPIGLDLEVFEDASGELQIDGAASGRPKFVPCKALYNNYGYGGSAFWFRFSTVNPEDRPAEWILLVDYAMLEHVTFFVPRSTGGYERHNADIAPSRERSLRHRTAAFEVTGPPGERTYYLRVKSNGPLNVPLSIMSHEAFQTKTEQETLWLWLYYGLMLGMVFYNLFLFFSVRDRSYLYYVIYIAFYTGFQFIHNGFGSLYFWPHAGVWWSGQSLYIFGVLLIVGMVLFARSFLETPKRAPWTDRFLKVLLIVGVGGMPALYWSDWTIRLYYNVLALVAATSMLSAGIIVLRQGFRPARLYVLGWSALLVGIVLGILKAVGVLPISALTNWGYQAASAVEAVLLSLALADRISHHRAEVEALATSLEKKVVERTESLEELHRQLLQSQKLEAVARLAGGVAHDMNNVLGAIMATSSFLQEQMGPNDPYREEIADILSASHRGKELTSNLLGFARKGAHVTVLVDLNEVAQTVIRILSRTVQKKIKIDTDLDVNIAAVAGDRDQLTHALMNLCLNSVDAVGKHGRMTIETRRVEHKTETRVGQETLPAGPYVELVVTDTGKGMDEESLSRAFEPFFTTKAAGEGTGLGLSMVYGVVTRMGGVVSLESVVGQGTRVAIVLPALLEADAREPLTVDTHAREQEIPSGQGCVLLIDDEPLLRKAGFRLLSSLGYEVLMAEGGKQASAIFAERHQEIDLVLMDMIMPGMDGVETFEALRKIDPEANVVVVSGFSQDGRAEGLIRQGAIGFLGKPFDLKEVAAVVREGIKRSGTSKRSAES